MPHSNKKLKKLLRQWHKNRSRPRTKKRYLELHRRWFNKAYRYKGACVDPDPYMDVYTYLNLEAETNEFHQQDFQKSSKLYNPETLTFIVKDQMYYLEVYPIPDSLNERWEKANQKAIENYNRAKAERGF